MWSDRGVGRLPATMILPDLLWVGGTLDALDVNGLHSHGIEARLNLRTTELSSLSGIITHWHPLIDWYGNKPEKFVQAVDKLTTLMKNKIPTLIHCHMGISRSPTVLATWWAKDTGVSFDQALDVVRKMRPFVMPHYGLRALAREYLQEAPVNDSTG